MIIRITKVNNAELTGPERRNYNVLRDAVLKLEALEEFKNTIGAMLMCDKQGSHLILSAFSSAQLHQFITVLMIELRDEDLKVSYSNRNDQHELVPLWSNKIRLLYADR